MLVGTSDIKIDHPDEIRCTDEEIDYFIGMISRVFPTIKVTREHIVFQFTGVRPLGSSGAIVGGAVVAKRNVISGNGGNGVAIGSALGTGNSILGNYIGVDKNGDLALTNTTNGFQIQTVAHDNIVGGSLTA